MDSPWLVGTLTGIGTTMFFILVYGLLKWWAWYRSKEYRIDVRNIWLYMKPDKVLHTNLNLQQTKELLESSLVLIRESETKQQMMDIARAREMLAALGSGIEVPPDQSHFGEGIRDLQAEREKNKQALPDEILEELT